MMHNGSLRSSIHLFPSLSLLLAFCVVFFFYLAYGIVDVAFDKILGNRIILALVRAPRAAVKGPTSRDGLTTLEVHLVPLLGLVPNRLGHLGRLLHDLHKVLARQNRDCAPVLGQHIHGPGHSVEDAHITEKVVFFDFVIGCFVIVRDYLDGAPEDIKHGARLLRATDDVVLWMVVSNVHP